MNYVIKEKFGPGSEDWEDYARWAGLEHCQEYCSIDGVVSKNLFTPKSAEDWGNCVNADFKLHLLTNLDFARKCARKHNRAEILGAIEDPKSSRESIPARHMLVGYDIIDVHNSISLLTDRGGRDTIADLTLNKFALLEDMDDAYQLKGQLRQDYPDDDHASECEVWAVYKLDVQAPPDL